MIIINILIWLKTCVQLQFKIKKPKNVSRNIRLLLSYLEFFNSVDRYVLELDLKKIKTHVYILNLQKYKGNFIGTKKPGAHTRTHY